MEREKNYGERSAEESEFHLRIPEGPPPRPQGGFIELRGGDGGHHSYQEYAQYCLDEQGGDPGLEAFKAKFTAWSLEDTGGAVLYPEGPAFKVFGSNFQEGTPPMYTLHAGAAHYTALMLCLHPTDFPPDEFGEVPGDMQPASYEVQSHWEEDGNSLFDYTVIAQKTIASTGEIFLWKHSYSNLKISFKIRIFPAPDGRNVVYWGGRLGTFPSPSETL